MAKAAGVKVTPAELKIESKAGVVAKREIVVENPSSFSTLFDVYPDDFSDWILVKPESFILENKEKQEVTVEIQGKESGVFLTHISVRAQPITEAKFRANSGVKIPLEIKITEDKKAMFLAAISNVLEQSIPVKHLFLIIVFSVLLLSFTLLLLKRKSRSY